MRSHPGFEAVLAKDNKAAGAIHINPAHKGLLHKETHTPMGQAIPEDKIKAAEHSEDPAIRRRAQFADNAKGFKHK